MQNNSFKFHVVTLLVVAAVVAVSSYFIATPQNLLKRFFSAISTTPPGSLTLSQPSVTCSAGIPNVSLSWTASTGADRYSVQRKVGSNTSATGFSDSIMSMLTTTSYTDDRFASSYGRTYHAYRIIAKKGTSLETYSDVKVVMLPECAVVLSPIVEATSTPSTASTTSTLSPTPTPTTPTPSPVVPPPAPAPSPMVPPSAPAPSLTVSASPTSIAYGGTSRITWSSTNSTSCSVSNGLSGTSGAFTTPALTASTTYSVTCTGTGGTLSRSVVVGVAAAPTPTPTPVVGASSPTPVVPPPAPAPTPLVTPPAPTPTPVATTASLGTFTLAQPTVTCNAGLPNVSLSWTASAGAERYSVQRKVGNDTLATGFSSEIMSMITTTRFTDSLFSSTYGRTYHAYRIIAKKGTSQMVYSDVKTILLPDCRTNALPTATISLPLQSMTVTQGTSVSFVGVGADSDGTILGHEWRDGSCTLGTPLSSSASFTKADLSLGTHTVVYRVRDNTGAWSTTCPSRVITVITPPAVVSSSTKFIVGDQIVTTTGVNVRTTANTNGTLLGSQALNAQGTIVGGPMYQGGYHWWNVNYNTGVDGWSVQDFLSKLVVATPAPSPVPPPAPAPTPVVPPPAPAPTPVVPPPAPAPTPTPVTPTPTPTPPAASTKFPSWMTWGASVGWESNKMDDFVALVGKQPQMEAIFSHWGNQTFPFQYTSRIKDKGRTMVIFWEAVDYNRPYFQQPEYGFDAVNSGSLDAFFTKYAQDAKTYGAPVILIPYSEFNGNWYPWGMTITGNTPQKFISAWTRIYGIFQAAGATNVKFAWVPNNDSVPDVAANNFDLNWPGAQYVDYVGLDGFNSATQWETFDKMMNTEIGRLKKYNKPIYIFSLGAGENPNKPAWITDAFTVQLYKHPEVKGWIWFNENKEQDWRVNSSPASLEAFKSMLP